MEDMESKNLQPNTPHKGEYNSATSISDLPFNGENDLGTTPYINGLVDFIKDSAMPITIALQGEWGSGKTSLMNTLRDNLCEKDKPFLGIHINTWEYSMMSSPEQTVYKILNHLIVELTKGIPFFRKKFKRFLRGTGNFFYRGGREALKAIPGAGIALEAMNVPSQLRLSKSSDDSLAELKKALENAIEKRIEKINKKIKRANKRAGKESQDNKIRGVIIFVDDLDRLNPPLAVEILELLKNVFTVNKCIFILAIDYDVVVKGLEPKFGKKTDENEREFRSFFDKIIQVPFLLPINSYEIRKYVLDSLEKVKYLTTEEKDNEAGLQKFTNIVEYSVGKNPRAIKRLINTLSLLARISWQKKGENMSFEQRVTTFAIVAIQICYRKIYEELLDRPGFNRWDENGWKNTLSSVCESDAYLSERQDDIDNLFKLILGAVGDNKLEECVASIIGESSLIGINDSSIAQTNESHVGSFDKKKLIGHIHDSVIQAIKNNPEEIKIKPKRNTGNGGFDVFYENTKSMEIILHPYPKKDNKIGCEIIVPTGKRRPERLIGKSVNEIIGDTKVKSLFDIMDKCVAPLLSDNTDYFSGRKYSGYNTYFKSFSEEQKFRFEQGWLDKHLSAGVSYWITFEDADDTKPLQAITDVIIAAYKFRKAAQDI